MVNIKHNYGFINLSILYRTYKDSNDYWDMNWLTVNMEVLSHGNINKKQINLRIDELVDLSFKIDHLLNNVIYDFQFNPMEPWININFFYKRENYFLMEVEIVYSLFSNSKKDFFEIIISREDLIILRNNIHEDLKNYI